jgi:hypothetical protein
LDSEEQKEENDLCIDRILRLVAKEVTNRLQSCSFIIKLHVRVDVMT